MILTRIIEGYSADLSDLADLPPCSEDFEMPRFEEESEIAESANEEEECFIMPVPEFVTTKKKYETFDDAYNDIVMYTKEFHIITPIVSSNSEEKDGIKHRIYGVIQCHTVKAALQLKARTLLKELLDVEMVALPAPNVLSSGLLIERKTQKQRMDIISLLKIKTTDTITFPSRVSTTHIVASVD